MPLNGSAIRAVSGEIYGHLFENRSTGISRGLFWNLVVKCAPITFDGDEWDCSVSCNWLCLPIQDWQELHGITLASVRNPRSIESSFYLMAHHAMRLDSLGVERVGNLTSFGVTIEGTFDLRGFDKLDVEGCQLSVKCEASFQGIFVVPNNLWPKPQSPAQAASAVEPFFALDNLEEPCWDRFRYVLAPLAHSP